MGTRFDRFSRRYRDGLPGRPGPVGADAEKRPDSANPNLELMHLIVRRQADYRGDSSNLLF
jgi:hypothetical protein